MRSLYLAGNPAYGILDAYNTKEMVGDGGHRAKVVLAKVHGCWWLLITRWA